MNEPFCSCFYRQGAENGSDRSASGGGESITISPTIPRQSGMDLSFSTVAIPHQKSGLLQEI
jgi:hypothetical protein